LKRRGQRRICALLIVLAGIASLFTDVWPVLTPLGGRFVAGASLFFAILLWSISDDVPLPRGREHDR